jgi:ubiquinone/menaquinone biosynthesis C-methylase UbiE
MKDALFDQWSAYEKLVDNDYMHHRRFFRRLAAEIRRRFDAPVKILDLGCGDAAPIGTVLRDLNIGLYCGVDESETAMAMAGQRLSSLGISHELYPGDFRELLPRLQQTFDVIVASFSLHHLRGPNAKLRVLRDCLRLIEPGGLMIVIDVFLISDVTRKQYLRDWAAMARTRFTALDDEEISMLIEHVEACDFPESVQVYRKLGGEAGYAGVKCLEQEDTGGYRMLALEPPG